MVNAGHRKNKRKKMKIVIAKLKSSTTYQALPKKEELDFIIKNFDNITSILEVDLIKEEPTTTNESIGSFLRRERKKRNLKQREISQILMMCDNEKIKCEQWTYSQHERGKKKIKKERFDFILKNVFLFSDVERSIILERYKNEF